MLPGKRPDFVQQPQEGLLVAEVHNRASRRVEQAAANVWERALEYKGAGPDTLVINDSDRQRLPPGAGLQLPPLIALQNGGVGTACDEVIPLVPAVFTDEHLCAVHPPYFFRAALMTCAATGPAVVLP